jgi:hypothetical protein
MSENSAVHEFFDQYTRALLARDEKTVADLYAVPSLILFPGRSIAVSDNTQTEEFFASAWGQYDGITDTAADITVVAETTHSIWADVTWRHDSGATERLLYQLVDTGQGWKIAVLTPLDQ